MSFRPLPAAALALVAASSCAPSFDVRVAWTVDGLAADVACVEDEDVRVTIASRERADDATADETFALAKCTDGETLVRAGAVSRLRVELVDGDDVIGVSRPTDVRPPLLDTDEVVTVDIEATRGTLRARLLLAGKSCDVAGASTFEVSLARTSDGIEDDLVAEHVEVTCQDGDAFYIDHDVAVGARYRLRATTTLDGNLWSTPEPDGADIRTDHRQTFVDVDLRRVD